MDRVKELEQQIKEAAQKYYTDGSSPLTDMEFDALVEELRSRDPNSYVLNTGWGYDVDLDSTPGKKVKHRYGEVGSLEKCHNWKELGPHLQKTLVDISLKLDGISVVLYYKNGKMYQALTRGGKENIGVDITDKVRKIFDVPCNESNFTGAVRGEILMSYRQYEKYSKDHPDAKNPRNTTAGLINAKEISEDLKYLDILVYTILADESNVWMTYTHSMRERLTKMFDIEHVVPYVSEEILVEERFLQRMNECAEMYYGEYPADGLVITAEQIESKISNYITYDAKAFKFPAESKECEVVQVLWNMTKSHYAVPKIQLKSVQLSGTDVAFCTGYNAKYILDNNIGTGTKLVVCKSGEIIPNVVEVIEPTGAQMIHFCPVCEEPLTWNGVHLQCNNPVCGNAVLQDTLWWIMHLVPMDGLGEKLIIKMLSDLVVGGVIADASIENIMNCTLKLDEEHPSAQTSLFAKMWNNLHTATFSLSTALVATNIPRLGEITSGKLAENPTLVKNLVFDPYEDLEYKLAETIGVANSVAVINNINKLQRLKLIWTRIATESSSTTTKGKVAITGKLSVKRAEFEKELKAAGYQPTEISKDTRFLITDNPNSSSSKNKKADDWGITKITEAEFRDKYL